MMFEISPFNPYFLPIDKARKYSNLKGSGISLNLDSSLTLPERISNSFNIKS